MKSKRNVKLFMSLLAIVLVLSISTTAVFAGSSAYKRVGSAFPNIIGLGATDTISWTKNGNSIANVLVSQKGGNFLGIINTKPTGYSFVSSNKIRTTWTLTVSIPYKIFNLEKGISVKTLEYTLSPNGSISLKVISNKKIK